jgi:hypothetical protein
MHLTLGVPVMVATIPAGADDLTFDVSTAAQAATDNQALPDKFCGLPLTMT